MAQHGWLIICCVMSLAVIIAVGLPQSTTSTAAPQPPTVKERCQQNKTAVFSHPTKCQLYYNCSKQGEPDFLEECPFPQLFDSDSLRCENSTDFDCGQKDDPYTKL